MKRYLVTTNAGLAGITQTNAIYIIRNDLTLSGTLNVPANSVLEFDGGSITGGVINGSLTSIKAPNRSVILSEMTGSFTNDYFPVEWFGAKGDATTDSTDAFRLALYNSDSTGVPVFVGNGQFVITGTLNYYKSSYRSYRIQIQGCQSRVSKYGSDKYGCIKFNRATGVNGLFCETGSDPSGFNGYIKNVCIIGQRDLECYFFYNTIWRGLIEGCLISQFGAMFADTSLWNLSCIKNNMFLSCYYFSKSINRNVSATDTQIIHNYINGGAEKVYNSGGVAESIDDDCFQFNYMNGCQVMYNFIDYYRTIYHPINRTVDGGQSFQGPISIGNHYQVFRYFYYYSSGEGKGINAMSILSDGDGFNWTNPANLQYLSDITPIQSTIHGTAINLPPYIYRGNAQVFIKNAKLESNLVTPMVLTGSMTGYPGGVSEFTVSGEVAGYSFVDLGISGGWCYNGDPYKYAKISTNFLLNVSSLPTFTLGWCQAPPGMKVIYNNHVYEAVIEYSSSTQQYTARWKDIQEA